jgi:hypothetical protein
MYVLNTRRLVEELARGRVSERNKAYYLLVGWLLYVGFGYSTLVFANQGRDWLALFEVFMVIMIAVLGIQGCYEVSGGDSNRHFVVDFTCLLVPLTIKVYVVVWGLYWLLAWGHHSMLSATFYSEGTARMVAFFSRHAGWLMTLMAVLTTQAALFLRMRVHMKTLADLRETSNPLMQPTGPRAAGG